MEIYFDCGIDAPKTTVFMTYKGEQTMLERQMDSIFYGKCTPKSVLTATTLAGPSIKHWVLGGYILLNNDENAQKFV